MAFALRGLGRQAKRPSGFRLKMTAVSILGLCFIFVWYIFSSPSSSLTIQRQSFDDIAEPTSASTTTRVDSSTTQPVDNHETRKDDDKVEVLSDSKKKYGEKINGYVSKSDEEHEFGGNDEKQVSNEKNEKIKVKEESDDVDSTQEDVEEVVDVGKEEETDVANEEAIGETEGDGDSVNFPDQKDSGKMKKVKGPLFDPKMQYVWKLCNTRSKQNYIPCIDNERLIGKLPAYRHTERSCPRIPPTCLVPLPHDGYETTVPWPESKLKIVYKNVAHPKLAAYVQKHSWVLESGEHLIFPQNQSVFNGGVLHYLESIEETVPDIEWGKNIRVVLDIGCTDSSFVASLFDKDVVTLTLGLKEDLVDLAQVALERGFPVIVSPLARNRLPYPSGVFDAIHCGSCSIPWHSNGGKHLLEMNRILRPGGYFILSSKHDNIEDGEAMTMLTSSICWNILADKSDEVSEVGVKIYQKPESNDIYELRRKKNPPLCNENEDPDATWYVPMKTCLHNIPSAIEQHGAEWPEVWPKRLETYPDWINDKEKVIADATHWKAVVEKSYITGMGIDWSRIRNVMDMKSIYGGFAAALSHMKVWVMNVVPVHAPDTLPIIYERGLVGIYHDWCESFASYPRSYDLLHVDHLFSRLKNRCKQPVSIVVEMDRLLRPGGWAIIRDKVEILDSLERILRSLHWDIQMTYAQNKEGILCAQKTSWRP